jgi:hypothetical protein
MQAHLSGDVAGKVAVGDEFEMALVTGLVVLNGHVAVIVNPQFADDDVMNGGGHLAPSVMVARSEAAHTLLRADKAVKANVLRKLDVRKADRNHRQIFASELGCHRKVLIHNPFLSFCVLSRSRRMVRHLNRRDNKQTLDLLHNREKEFDDL